MKSPTPMYEPASQAPISPRVDAETRPAVLPPHHRRPPVRIPQPIDAVLTNHRQRSALRRRRQRRPAELGLHVVPIDSIHGVRLESGREKREKLIRKQDVDV